MANAVLVVRIKGQADCPYWASTTMDLLKLEKKYRAVILPKRQLTWNAKKYNTMLLGLILMQS